MRRNRQAFTLVELLVVIGIISVLVAMLLPALNRAREQAKVVQCASNLHQLYTAMQIYTTTYNGYVLPARTFTGSSKNNYWCGINVLGPLFGMKQIGNSSAAQQDMLNRLARMLDCPSVSRTKDPASVFTVDYTYNSNLGDDRAYPNDIDSSGTTAYDATIAPWGLFKRTSQVPGNVLVAVDANDLVQANDERFGSVSDLTYKKRFIGWPHKHRANFLFFDGSIHLTNPWASTALDPYGQPLVTSGNPPPAIAPNPDLQDWMIKAPNNGTPPTPPALPNWWQRGRPIPFN